MLEDEVVVVPEMLGNGHPAELIDIRILHFHQLYEVLYFNVVLVVEIGIQNVYFEVGAFV